MGLFWSQPPPPPPPSILEKIMTSSQAIHMKEDPRVNSKLMMSTIGYPLSIIFTYALICLYIGPKFMMSTENIKFRKCLTPFLQVFNLVRLSMNGVLGVLLAYQAFFRLNYSPFCQALDNPSLMTPEEQHASNKIFHYMWAFYVFKLIEICDIFFLFGLNKNLTKFQLYHHITALAFAWLGVNYVGGGSSVVPVICTCWTGVLVYAVHSIVTKLQQNQNHQNQNHQNRIVMIFVLLQSGIILVHSCLNLWMDCGYPAFASSALIVYMLTFYGNALIQWKFRSPITSSKKSN